MVWRGVPSEQIWQEKLGGSMFFWTVPLSSLIGLGVWYICKGPYKGKFIWVLLLAPLSLLLAPIAFGLLLALVGLVDPQKKEGIEFLLTSPLGVAWGLFKYGIYWKLLPWAFGNHLIFWYLHQIDERRCIQSELSTTLRASRSVTR